MELYFPIRHLHIATAYSALTVLLVHFLLSLRYNAGWLRYVEWLNYLVLLTAAVGLLSLGPWALFQHHWLTVKFILFLSFWWAGTRVTQLHLRNATLWFWCVLAVCSWAAIVYLAKFKPF